MVKTHTAGEDQNGLQMDIAPPDVDYLAADRVSVQVLVRVSWELCRCLGDMGFSPVAATTPGQNTRKPAHSAAAPQPLLLVSCCGLQRSEV